MTKTAAQRFAVGFAALAAAGVIGGVTAVSLFGQQEPAQQVRTVSDETTTAPASEPAVTPTAATISASPTAAAESGPASAPAKKSTTTRKQSTVTEPNTAPEPATADETTEAPAPPGNSAPSGVETPPVGDPAPPLPGMGCLYPQEPNCPSPTAAS